jgi:hypothetical protein
MVEWNLEIKKNKTMNILKKYAQFIEDEQKWYLLSDVIGKSRTPLRAVRNGVDWSNNFSKFYMTEKGIICSNAIKADELDIKVRFTGGFFDERHRYIFITSLNLNDIDKKIIAQFGIVKKETESEIASAFVNDGEIKLISGLFEVSHKRFMFFDNKLYLYMNEGRFYIFNLESGTYSMCNTHRVELKVADKENYSILSTEDLSIHTDIHHLTWSGMNEIEAQHNKRFNNQFLDRAIQNLEFIFESPDGVERNFEEGNEPRTGDKAYWKNFDIEYKNIKLPFAGPSTFDANFIYSESIIAVSGNKVTGIFGLNEDEIWTKKGDKIHIIGTSYERYWDLQTGKLHFV